MTDLNENKYSFSAIGCMQKFLALLKGVLVLRQFAAQISVLPIS